MYLNIVNNLSFEIKRLIKILLSKKKEETSIEDNIKQWKHSDTENEILSIQYFMVNSLKTG